MDEAKQDEVRRGQYSKVVNGDSRLKLEVALELLRNFETLQTVIARRCPVCNAQENFFERVDGVRIYHENNCPLGALLESKTVADREIEG